MANTLDNHPNDNDKNSLFTGTIPDAGALLPTDTEPSLSPLVRLWVLRMLVPLGGNRRFIRNSDFDRDDLAIALGFAEEVNNRPENFAPKKIRAKIARLHREAEKAALAEPPGHNPVLEFNLNQFQALLGLGPMDRNLLRFALVIHTDSALDDAAEMLGCLSTAQLVPVLAGVLGVSEKAVREATSQDSPLLRSGIISLDPETQPLRQKIDIVSRQFASAISHEVGEPLALLKGILKRCSAPELLRSDYSHLEEDISVIVSYLLTARQCRRPGVNILFYGPPGTGKSQLARLLASEIGLELFEVTCEDKEGDFASGKGRVSAFRMAQTLFRQSPAIVVFDEIEDVFGSPSRSPFRDPRRNGSEPGKAWINRILENNAVPTVWITNSIDEIDSAYVRRFDYVLRVGQPPREAREALLVRTCGGMLPEATLRRLSSHPHLAPALITRAAGVLGQIQDARPSDSYEKDLVRMIDHTLRAQGHAPIAEKPEASLPNTYDPSFIHTSQNPEQLVEGIRRAGSARICLYGAPGTGKTAFGRYVADKLGRRLHLVRASDILSAYVGKTESNLAEAFAQARSSKSVLLIDEVDSFLQNRSRAQRSWEVTAVNEMLTQMESFPGVFIASTNLIEDLDPAALRRFDLKLRFLPLRTEQATQLLARHLATAGLPEATPEALRQLARLSTLTPGDFAAVERRHRFQPLASPEEFVRALAEECAQKVPASRGTIGFNIPGLKTREESHAA
jgi:transitional endoplasmic reticulum ATPase